MNFALSSLPAEGTSTMGQPPTPHTTWRNLATHFHCIDFIFQARRLPAELEPRHLAVLAAWATGEVIAEPGHDFHYYAGGRG